MKIQNSFRVGLLGGLGVIVAIAIGATIGSLATIITYVGAALFLALGLDPLVSWLEKHKFPRPLAIVTVLVGVLGIFAGLIFAIIPVISEQVQNAIKTIPDWRTDIVADIKVVAPPAGAAAAAKTYTVKAGDTLGAIAKAQLGDAGAYMKIFNANKDLLTDPDKIKPGQVLRLP